MLPGFGDDFLFALGDVVLIAHAAAPATTSAARLLRLREFALERIGLDEEHVGARFGVRVLGRGVDADDVAGHHLEIFQGKTVEPSASFAPFCLSKSTVFSGPPFTE